MEARDAGRFLFEISLIIHQTFENGAYFNTQFGIDSVNYYNNYYFDIDFFTDIMSIGQLMYTYYIVQFLAAGFILLLAVIGAVVLTMNNMFSIFDILFVNNPSFISFVIN